MRKPLAIIGALVIAAVTAVVTAQAQQWFDQVDDGPNRRDDLRSGSEIRATVTKVWLNDEGRTMVTPPGRLPDEEMRRALGQPGAAADDAVLQRIEQLGGVRAEELTLQIILEGRRNQQIRITSIAPEIEEKSEPLTGTLFNIPIQAGDASLRMLLDLDEDRPVVREVEEDDATFELKSGDPYFDANTISLNDNEQQVVVLRALTNRYFFTFRIKVTYQIGGETKDMVVDDNGKPFAITAMHYGSDPAVRSYEHAFSLGGDFSLCELPNPSRILEDSTC
jgi:hypothetical protein